MQLHIIREKAAALIREKANANRAVKRPPRDLPERQRCVRQAPHSPGRAMARHSGVALCVERVGGISRAHKIWKYKEKA
jgi:hypothetical protein